MRGLSEHEVRVLLATLEARKLDARDAYISTPDLDSSGDDYWGGYLHGVQKAIDITKQLVDHPIASPPGNEVSK